MWLILWIIWTNYQTNSNDKCDKFYFIFQTLKIETFTYLYCLNPFNFYGKVKIPYRLMTFLYLLSYNTHKGPPKYKHYCAKKTWQEIYVPFNQFRGTAHQSKTFVLFYLATWKIYRKSSIGRALAFWSIAGKRIINVRTEFWTLYYAIHWDNAITISYKLS